MGHNLSRQVALDFATRFNNLSQIVLFLDPDCWPGQVVAALRQLEAVGIRAKAINTGQKPHQMEQADIREALTSNMTF
jgi:hypothetical protein